MRLLNRVLLLCGLGFLIWLICSVGPGELMSQLRVLGWGIIPIILTEGLANLAHTLGWRQCLPGNSRKVPLEHLFRMAMAGFAINYLTPTASLGGDVTRAALLSSVSKAPEAFSSVLADKLCMGVAHVLIAMFGSVFLLFHIKLPLSIWLLIVVSLLLFAVGILAFLFIQKHGKLGALARWMGARDRGGRWIQKAAQRISDVDGALETFYRERPRALLRSIAWHLVGLGVAILQTWLFLQLLNRQAPFNLILVAAFLGLWIDLITFAVPMNAGALEGSRMLALQTIGLDAASGTAFGVAMRIAQVSWALFGLFNHGMMIARCPTSERTVLGMSPQPAQSVCGLPCERQKPS